jgi:hypothetical protein
LVIPESARVAVGSYGLDCLCEGSRTSVAKSYFGEHLAECWLTGVGGESSQKVFLQ